MEFHTSFLDLHQVRVQPVVLITGYLGDRELDTVTGANPVIDKQTDRQTEKSELTNSANIVQ